ncbi:hypothetical protein LTR37_000473 [Vermiconidia calcicola]|uniref:Uncharacterized protein n=1 Tax=Vermiconidia calcicola TaxID=1690605 RepID=A0ACC3NZ06_9PEZI|nr:hypothetical protein LTR37_000473 [Vermiconidia calcicola]
MAAATAIRAHVTALGDRLQNAHQDWRRCSAMLREKWDHFDQEYPMPTRRHSWPSSWFCTNALRRLDSHRTLILSTYEFFGKFENRRNMASLTIEENLADILCDYIQKPLGPESHIWIAFCTISDLDAEYNERRRVLHGEMAKIARGFDFMQRDYQDIHARAFDHGFDGFLERKRKCDEYMREHECKVEEARRRFECKEHNKEDDAVLEMYQQWKFRTAALEDFDYDVSWLQKRMAMFGTESARQTFITEYFEPLTE